MRHKEIDLTNEKKVKANVDLAISSKTTDSYLSNALDHYDSTASDVITTLKKNPLLISETEIIKIQRFDDLCFDYKDELYSIGGVINSASIPRNKKYQLINWYLNKQLTEYKDILKSKKKNTKDINYLIKDYQPKYVKFRTFLIVGIITALLFLLNFPFTGLKTWTFLKINVFYTNLENLFNNNFLLNAFRYLSIILSIITFILLLIYNIVSKVLLKKFKDITRQDIYTLKSLAGKQTRYINNIKRFLFRQINKPLNNKKTYDFNKFLKHRVKLNEEDISSITINNLTTTKKKIERIYRYHLVYEIIYFLLIIGYIVLLIINLIK